MMKEKFFPCGMTLAEGYALLGRSSDEVEERKEAKYLGEALRTANRGAPAAKGSAVLTGPQCR